MKKEKRAKSGSKNLAEKVVARNPSDFRKEFVELEREATEHAKNLRRDSPSYIQ